MVAHLTRKITPTPLDLKRIDEITRETMLQEKYLDAIGQKLLIFRGQGGAGKTMSLLQLAYQRYRDRGDRILFLSYNRALIADIRRLLRLMAVQNPFLMDGMNIKSVYGFIGQVLRALGVYSERLGCPSP